MKEFQIKLSELQEGYVVIGAKNEKEAKKKALQLITDNGFDLLDREIFRKIVHREVNTR